MKVLTIAVVFSAIMIVTAVLYTGGALDDLLEPEWQRVVANKFRDSESVRFSDVRDGQFGAKCGMVNAQNAFGAYGNAQYFNALPPISGRPEWRIFLLPQYDRPPIVGCH